MNEDIANKIALNYEKVMELRELKAQIQNSITDTTEFYIVTRHLVGWDIGIFKNRKKLDISNETLIALIDEVTEIMNKKINKLIDTAVDERIKSSGKE